MDKIIEQILSLRKELRPIIDNGNRHLGMFPFSRQNRNTIVDALVFLIMNREENKEDVKKESNEVIKALNDSEKLSKFILRLKKNVICFENTLNSALETFEISKNSKDDIKSILNSEKLKENVDANISINMYLLKGKFQWVNDSNSEFKEFLKNDKLDEITSDARINCWEAVLYGLMKAGVLDREFLKKQYSKGVVATERNLTKWFSFKTADKIKPEDWRSKLTTNSFLVMIDMTNGRGLDHDMISVPYTQKQMLKMMVTNDFIEKSFKPKVYSHWTMWTSGKVGSVKKEILDNNIGSFGNDYRVIPIEKLLEKTKSRNSIKSSWFGMIFGGR